VRFGCNEHRSSLRSHNSPAASVGPWRGHRGRRCLGMGTGGMRPTRHWCCMKGAILLLLHHNRSSNHAFVKTIPPQVFPILPPPGLTLHVMLQFLPRF
jgi:hypothetical protein